MVEFFDYNCGYCKRALADMIELMKTDPKLRSCSRNSRCSARARSQAAQVAVAVRMQDKTGKKYLDFHQKLLERPRPGRQGARARGRQGSRPRRGAAEKDMESDEVASDARGELQARRGARLNGTPSYVVGNEVVVGAVGLEAARGDQHRRCGKATC